MKNYIPAFFLILFSVFSMNSFAQIDSSKIASTERQIEKDQKKADRLERKAKKQERKKKRHEMKMERREKKRERKLKSIEKGERKIEDLKKDSTNTGANISLYRHGPIQSQLPNVFIVPSFQCIAAIDKLRNNSLRLLLDPHVFIKPELI